MKRNTRHSVVLRLCDPTTIDRLDNAAHNLNLSRSGYIRPCIIRGFEPTETRELSLLENRPIGKAVCH
jgi:predicted DNA-binding protein